MKHFRYPFSLFRKPFLYGVCLSLFLVLLLLSGCSKKLDYFSYVSELRSNVFLAQNEAFSLRVYAVTKERPYATDGVCEERTSRLEVYLVAPAGNEQTFLSIRTGEQDFSGEMSYDNVRGEYTYSCNLNATLPPSLDCVVTYGEREIALTANSVLTPKTLTPQAALERLMQAEEELFSSLTDKYGFAGEIYVRLIYEDAPYYYLCVIDRQSNAHAFLMNGETGKILARREA